VNTLVLSYTDATVYSQAVEVLRAGGLVAFPTDTVYGVGALAFDGPAVESIYEVKDRPPEKAIPVLLGDLDDLDKVALRVPPMALNLATSYWPGPLTLIVPKRLELPAAVSASETVGVRLPDHPVARALLRMAGPMAVTSANRSGLPAPSLAEEVLAQLGGRIALVIDGGKTPGGMPSTVVDCTTAEPQILRAGPVDLEQIRSVLEGKRSSSL
jgi:L-threonylcarbamoyladenylate synthase